MPKNVGFWDHSYHQKNNSTNFFPRLLEESFNVQTIWDNSWQGLELPKIEHINSLRLDAIIFFQCIPPPSYLGKLECKNRMWIPMWDDFSKKPPLFHLLYTKGQNVKILSFSKTLSDSIGEETSRVKFFPSLHNAQIMPSKGINAFFWQRGEIGFSTIKSLIGNTPINSLTIKLDPDPGYEIEIPTENDIEKYNIKILQGWLDKSNYISHLLKCNVFFSPRTREGIGMSFLEAMSMGLCVVSPDEATANEYIVDGENGLLYDPEKANSLKLIDANSLGKQARQFIKSNQDGWERDKLKIIELVKVLSDS